MKKNTENLQICERIETMGITEVNAEDLLCLLIGNRDKARRLLQDYSLFTTEQNCLAALRKFKLADFKFYGLTDLESVRLYAAIQLGAKVNCAQSDAYHIACPADGARLLMDRLKGETNERFLIVLLSTKNQVIKIREISSGSLSNSIVHPREVFCQSILGHAASIIVAHNHPSGDPYPSTQDRELTRALADAGSVVGIPVLDHLVIGENRYYSFKEHSDVL